MQVAGVWQIPDIMTVQVTEEDTMVAVVVAVGAGGTMTAAAEVEGTVEVEGVEEMAEVVESEVVAVDQTVGSIVFEGSPPPPPPS